MLVARGLANDGVQEQSVYVDVSEYCQRVTITLTAGAISIRGIFNPKDARHVAAVIDSYADEFDPRD